MTAHDQTARSAIEDAIKGGTEWLISALYFRKNSDPGPRFERPAGLMCSRRVHGLSSAHIAQDAPKDSGDLRVVSEPTPTPGSATKSASMPANPNAVYTGIVETVSTGNSTQSVHLAQYQVLRQLRNRPSV